MIELSTREAPTEASFQKQLQRTLASEEIMARSILFDRKLAGYVVSFRREGKLEVSYWLGSHFWGRGLATAALFRFLAIQHPWPIHARVAKSNLTSCSVLQKCGRHQRGPQFLLYRNRKSIEEFILVLAS